MTDAERADWLRRIREAPHIGALAALERELVTGWGRDADAGQILGQLSLRWKRLEARN